MPYDNQTSLRCNECKDKEINDLHFNAAYINYNFFLIIILVPMISIFGLFSNVVNLLIYTRPRLSAFSSSSYLAALACSDFMVVFTGILVIFMDSARSYLLYLSDSMLKAILVALPFAYVVQSCSIYFTVALAIDSYCKTATQLQWCTVRCAKKTVAAIAVCSILYNTPRAMMFELLDCSGSKTNSTKLLTHHMKRMCPTELFYQSNTIYNVYMYSGLIVIGPFLTMLILNALVIQHSKRGNVANGSQTATKMVVGLFLVCNILTVVTNILENFLTPSLETLNYMVDASNVLVVINSSFNFFIYLVYDPVYKTQFVQTFCGFLGHLDNHPNGELRRPGSLSTRLQMSEIIEEHVGVQKALSQRDLNDNLDQKIDENRMDLPQMERLI